MALDDFLDSNYSKTLPRVSRGLAQSLDSSNLLHKDEQFQTMVATFFGKVNRNLSSTDAGISHINLGKNSHTGNQVAIHSASNLMNVMLESHHRLPEGIPPVSKYPQLLKTSETSIKDGSSTLQDVSYLNSSLGCRRKQLTATCHDASQERKGLEVPLDIKLESLNLCLKKPRLQCSKDVVLQECIVKQLMENKDSLQLQGQMVVQHKRFQNEKNELILQSFPLLHHVIDGKQHAQEHTMHHIQQPDLCQVPTMHLFYGVCARRLMQYMYHLRHRPSENGIVYWRKFVEEYYAPHAKQRWCFTGYDNVGHPSTGVFPQADVTEWHCNICGSRSGRGFEVTSQALPRLNKVSFESGVLDEILFLDLPCEHRFPSGLMVLEYEKAVQESVYEQLRVVREGKLRIVFTCDLKIQSWEFCVRHHEELQKRSVIVPHVSRLVDAVEEYLKTINGSNKVSPHDLQEDCNRLLTTGHQLARNLGLQLLDDLGFCKRYIRCLQIAGVVESMRDLMTFCRDNDVGPVEGLKKFPQKTASIKPLRGEGRERLPLESVRSQPTDHKKLMVLSPDESNITCKSHLNGSHVKAPGKLSRQTLMSSSGKWKEAPSQKRKRSNKSASAKPLPDSKTWTLGLSQDLQVNDLSSYNFSESSKNIQAFMIKKWLQELISNRREGNKGDKEVKHRINCTTLISDLQTKAQTAHKLNSELNFNGMVTTAASRNLSSSGGKMQNLSAASSRESYGVFGNVASSKENQICQK